MLYNYQESISKHTAYTQSFHIGHQAMYMEVGKVKQGSSNGRIILTVKLITPPYWLVKYIICVGWQACLQDKSIFSFFSTSALVYVCEGFFMSFGGQDLGSNWLCAQQFPVLLIYSNYNL